MSSFKNYVHKICLRFISANFIDEKYLTVKQIGMKCVYCHTMDISHGGPAFHSNENSTLISSSEARQMINTTPSSPFCLLSPAVLIFTGLVEAKKR